MVRLTCANKDRWHETNRCASVVTNVYVRYSNLDVCLPRCFIKGRTKRIHSIVRSGMEEALPSIRTMIRTATVKKKTTKRGRV